MNDTRKHGAIIALCEELGVDPKGGLVHVTLTAGVAEDTIVSGYRYLDPIRVKDTAMGESSIAGEDFKVVLGANHD